MRVRRAPQNKEERWSQVFLPGRGGGRRGCAPHNVVMRMPLRMRAHDPTTRHHATQRARRRAGPGPRLVHRKALHFWAVRNQSWAGSKVETSYVYSLGKCESHATTKTTPVWVVSLVSGAARAKDKAIEQQRWLGMPIGVGNCGGGAEPTWHGGCNAPWRRPMQAGCPCAPRVIALVTRHAWVALQSPRDAPERPAGCVSSPTRPSPAGP